MILFVTVVWFWNSDDNGTAAFAKLGSSVEIVFHLRWFLSVAYGYKSYCPLHRTTPTRLRLQQRPVRPRASVFLLFVSGVAAYRKGRWRFGDQPVQNIIENNHAKFDGKVCGDFCPDGGATKESERKRNARLILQRDGTKFSVSRVARVAGVQKLIRYANFGAWVALLCIVFALRVGGLHCKSSWPSLKNCHPTITVREYYRR